MGGMLAEQDFIRFEFQSRKQVDHYTSYRIRDDLKDTIGLEGEFLPYQETLEMLMYELIGISVKADITGELQQTSVSNNGISVSYAIINEAQIKKEQKRLIKQYLSGEADLKGTPLLYLGA